MTSAPHTPEDDIAPHACSTAARKSAGNAEAWLDDYGEALYRFALSRVGNADDAADLVQDTLLAAFTARDRFEGRSTVRTWLIGILVRRIAQFRRERARGARAIDLGPDAEEQAFNRRGKWCGLQPVRGADDALADALRDCIAALPERSADAFLLREQFELDADATSEVLDVSTTNLSTILHRARLALRSCIERKCNRREDVLP